MKQNNKNLGEPKNGEGRRVGGGDKEKKVKSIETFILNI